LFNELVHSPGVLNLLNIEKTLKHWAKMPINKSSRKNIIRKKSSDLKEMSA
jgi:hypothetical protein